jgi:hypothetical protein
MLHLEIGEATRDSYRDYRALSKVSTPHLFDFHSSPQAKKLITNEGVDG